MIIPCGEVDRWLKSADVIVVGCGIAGVCAAIAAREAGAAALVLERSSGCSGSTAAAAGHFYLGGGTAVQIACGFHDDAQALADYLTAVASSPDEEKISAFAEGSAAHFAWLEARGVPFDRSYYPLKAVIQPGRECLIWTGNERVWPFRDQARPAPRGHKVAFDGLEGGGALALDHLAAHARTIGVEAVFDTKVDALVCEGDRIAPKFDGIAEALAAPDTQLRLFGKPEIVGKRRMGLALALGASIEEARAKARNAAAAVSTTP